MAVPAGAPGLGPLRSAVTGGMPFLANRFVSSERYRRLDRRHQYYECTQHDEKRYDFDGRMVRFGDGTFQPLLTTEVAPYFVPLRMRRPSAPYRICKIVVDAFTSLIFGDEKWPGIECADAATRDYCEALSEAASLPAKMIQARNLAGSVGAVAISWCFVAGLPQVSVHNVKNIFVHRWANRSELVPAALTEVYVYDEDRWDVRQGRVVSMRFWYRRDWDEQTETCYVPAPYEVGKEPNWLALVDSDATVEHGLGFCPVVWVQNVLHQDADAVPDFVGIEEKSETIDVLSSVLARGTCLNLDPTLVLKMDPEIVRRGVKKGSDNALSVGEEGDAKYLELSGSAVEAGVKLFDKLRMGAFEAAQCVVPDPNEIAASGTSSVAMKVIYQPMLGKAGLIREQFAKGIKRLLVQMLAAARSMNDNVTVDVDDDGNPILDSARQTGVMLPAKVTSTPAVDDEGNPTGEQETNEEDRDPGTSDDLKLVFGEWFPPTADDVQKMTTTLSTASGKPIVSQQTATEVTAKLLGRDPVEEWKRVSAEGQKEKDAQAEMFQQSIDAAGGKVDDEEEDEDPEDPAGGVPAPKPPFGGGKFGAGGAKPFGGRG